MLELFLQQAANAAMSELGKAMASDPVGTLQTAEQVLGGLFGSHHHTGYDVIQDIWDAVESGGLSHSAALQATAILAADLEKRRQPPVTVPYGSMADIRKDIARRKAEGLPI